MNNFKKVCSIILSITMLFGLVAIPAYADTSKEVIDAGHMIINADDSVEYYIDGKLQIQRSVTSTHGEMSIEHESWKEYLNENFRGCTWTDMWYTERPFRYPRHYTRVKAYSGDGKVSDSGRIWVDAGSKRAEAQTAYIYKTATHRIESWWGYTDD